MKLIETLKHFLFGSHELPHVAEYLASVQRVTDASRRARNLDVDDEGPFGLMVKDMRNGNGHKPHKKRSATTRK